MQQGHLRRDKGGEGEGAMGGMARRTLCREYCRLRLAFGASQLGLSILIKHTKKMVSVCYGEWALWWVGAMVSGALVSGWYG